MEQTLSKRVMKMAWPSVLENLSTMLVIFADTAMVGVLGAEATAAVAVNASPSWLINGIIFSLGIGGTALVSRSIGAGRNDEARHIARQVIMLGIFVSVFIFALTMLIAPYIPILMGSREEIHAPARDYMRLVALGFIPHFTGIIISAQLRGAGDAKTPMHAGIMANILNIVFNFLLIYPTRSISVFGLKLYIFGAGLGVRGAAIASAIGTAFAGIYIISKYISKKVIIYPPKEKYSPDLPLIHRVMRLSVPAMLERLSINLGQVVFASFVNRIGTVEIAAHHIAITIEALGYMPGHGFAVPATALVGQSLGANDPKEAKRLGLKSTAIGVGVMSVMGLIIFLFAKPLMTLFINDSETQILGAALLRICALQQPFSSLSIIVPGALRGAGDTVTPFVISLFSMWGVRILLAYIFSTYLGLGIYGIWFAMLLDLTVRGILMLLRFLAGSWQTKRI